MVEKVTRSLRSERLNRAKYDRLARLAVLCGKVRADAWQRCSGVSTVLQSPYEGVLKRGMGPVKEGRE